MSLSLSTYKFSFLEKCVLCFVVVVVVVVVRGFIYRYLIKHLSYLKQRTLYIHFMHPTALLSLDAQQSCRVHKIPENIQIPIYSILNEALIQDHMHNFYYNCILDVSGKKTKFQT